MISDQIRLLMAIQAQSHYLALCTDYIPALESDLRLPMHTLFLCVLFSLDQKIDSIE